MVVQDKAYMANIKNSNRSASMGAIADALLSGKSGLNEYEIKKWMPLIGGTGLGDIFMGQAPELVDDVSYYGPQAAFKGGNRASGGLGTLQPKRETFDAAMLGMDATGLASLVTKLGGKLSKSALNKMAIEAGNLSRRDFLKGSAAVAGGAALGGLLKLGRETGEQVAKHSTDNVVSTAAKDAPKKYKYNSPKEYADGLNRRPADEIAPDLNPMYDQELPHNYNMVNDPKYVDGYSRYIKENLASNDEALYNKAKTLIAKDKPINYQEADSFGAFSPQAKAEMKELKRHYQINYDMDNGILPGGSTGWIELLDDAVQPGFWNTVYP